MRSLCLLLLCLGVASVAQAQDAPRAQALLERGYQLMSQGDQAGAEASYLEARQRAPRYWPVYLVLGDFYLRHEHQQQRALEYYQIYAEHADAWSPGMEEALSSLLACHERLGQWPQAAEAAGRLADFYRARRDHPQARAARRRRAQDLLLADQAQEALDTIQAVIFDDFQDAEAVRIRAHARFYLGRYTEALEDLRFVRAHFGQGEFVNRDIGVTLLRLDLPLEAEQALRRSLRFDGEQAETWRWLAAALEEQGDKPGAEEAYRRSLALGGSPGLRAQVRNNLAWLMALESPPGSPRLLSALALAQRAVRDTQAREPAYCDTLAEVLLRLGRPLEARRWSWRALAAAPADPYLRQQHRRIQAASRGMPSPGPTLRLQRRRTPPALPKQR